MSKLLGPSYVFIVLGIRDYALGQTVWNEAVFTTRADAKTYMAEREATDTPKWFKIQRKELK